MTWATLGPLPVRAMAAPRAFVQARRWSRARLGEVAASSSRRLLLAVPAIPLLLLAGQARAQVNIPLNYTDVTGVWRLGITVGINSTTPQMYLFDTGSTVFSAFNSSSWGPTSAPIGQTTTCYGSDSSGFCHVGQIVQVPTLNFYAAGAAAGSTPAATLTTSQGGASAPAGTGYLVGQIDKSTESDKGRPGKTIDTFPLPDGKTPKGGFYGTFGAANYSGSTIGGVLGQTVIPGMYRQGYVVAANGQPNPGSSINPPTVNTSVVTVGGVSQQVNSGCIACVTVGLTQALVGQFGPINNAVAVKPGNDFPNPYGTGTANPGSTEFGVTFTTTLGSGPSAVSSTRETLLDSGTMYFWLTGKMKEDGGSKAVGTPVSISAASAAGGTLRPSLSTIASTSDSDAYSITFKGDNAAANTIGIPFFMQNSVMYDLTGGLIGYTSFYVTAANLATTASGPLVVGGTNVPLGIAGVISGAGGVTVNNGGQLQLSNTNTYTGMTTVASGGQLNISGPGSIINSAGVSNDGTFDISGAWSPVVLGGLLSGGGTVNLGGQNLTVVGGGSFAGTMADGGWYGGTGGRLTIAGGAFSFSGTGTFTGGTLVSSGTLTLQGSLASAVTTQSGGIFINQGTLTGGLANAGSTSNTGTIAGNVLNTGSFAHNGVVTGSVANAGLLSGNGTIAGNVANAGVISPGNSIGTLTIGGSHVHMAGGTHYVEVAGNGQSDLIRVGGSSALQGGVVTMAALPGTTLGPRTTYTILSAAGGVSGTYASVVDPYPFLLPSLSYDANNVYLTVQMGGFAAAAANRNQAAVGRVLDANVFTASGDFAQVLGSMAANTQSNALAQATLTALSGQNYSTFSSTMVQGAYLFLNNFANQTSGGGSPVSNRVALAEACDIACDVTPPAVWGAWGGALGGLGTIGAGANTGAVTYNVGGFAAGLDRLVAPGLRVGVTTGYTTGTQWTSGFSGTGMTDTFLAGLYGGYKMNKVYADAVFGYAYSYNQMWRQIFIPGLQQRTAQGRAGANQFYGQIEGGYRFDIGTAADAYITPFMRWQGYTGAQNGFTESGAQSLNLTVAGQTTNSLRSVIGAQLGGAIDLGWREKLALQFRLGWSHEYASTARPVTATLAGAPLMPFTTYGIAPTRDGAVVGFSANTAIADGTSMYLRYEGNISGSDSAHALTTGVRMTW